MLSERSGRKERALRGSGIGAELAKWADGGPRSSKKTGGVMVGVGHI